MSKKSRAEKSEKNMGSGTEQAKSVQKATGKRALDDRQVMLISKALADPTRMSVLRTIAKGNASCGDLRNCLTISAATLSHHMKELENAGLIETSREGRFLHATLQKKTWKSYLGELKDLGN